MIGKIVSFLALVAVAYAAVAPKYWVDEDERPMAGVDPNTMSCDPLGQVHLLLPHFKDCDKYYMCVHGEEIERQCAPGGLYFDWEKQVCGWATLTKCWRRDSVGEGSGMDESEFSVFGEEIENGPVGQLTAESSGTVRPVSALSARQANNAAGLNCENPHMASRQVPYKGDCQRYWRCIEGVPQLSICTDGLFFNEATMQCDHEANVRCLIEITEELNGEFLRVKD